MNNFEFEHDGQKLWYSRSLACSLVVMRYDDTHDWRETDHNSLEVLVTKRGQGCEYNKGKWNIPGGFIDFNETAAQCAIRELFEETGIKVPEDKVNFVYLNTNPGGARQTMAATFYALFPKEETLDWEFTTEFSEPGETEEIRWMHIEDIACQNKKDWTRGQIENIALATMKASGIFDKLGISNPLKHMIYSIADKHNGIDF